MNEQQSGVTMEPVVEATCAKCGLPLSHGKAVNDIIASVKDNYGVYHSECWVTTRRRP